MAENHDDQHFPAGERNNLLHGVANERQLHLDNADHRPEHRHRLEIFIRQRRSRNYILNALLKQHYPEMCCFCFVVTKKKGFIEHLNSCEEANLAGYQKKMVFHRFLSDDYSCKQLLYKLRVRLELEYLKAKLDNKNIEEMDCVNCPTFAEHMAGKCMDDHQRAAFIQEANNIGAQILAHFEQFLETEIQITLNWMTCKPEDHVNAIQESFEELKIDLDGDYPRQKNTSGEVAIEVQNYLARTKPMHFILYRCHIDKVEKFISDALLEMMASISELNHSACLRRITEIHDIQSLDDDDLMQILAEEGNVNRYISREM